MLVYLFTDLEAEPESSAGPAEGCGRYNIQCDLRRWRYFDERHGSAAGVRREQGAPCSQRRGQKVCRSIARRMRLTGGADCPRWRRRKTSGSAADHRGKVGGRGTHDCPLDRELSAGQDGMGRLRSELGTNSVVDRQEWGRPRSGESQHFLRCRNKSARVGWRTASTRSRRTNI